MVVITSFTLPFLKIFHSIMTIVRLLVNLILFDDPSCAYRDIIFQAGESDISVYEILKMCIFIKFYDSFAHLSVWFFKSSIDCYGFRS